MTTLTQSRLPEPVAQKLTGLRRSVTGWLALDGVSLAVIVLCLLIAADMLLDWWFRFDRISRAICLFLAVGTMALLIYRKLVRPLTRPLDDDALALRVEGAHGRLAQSLISALQFSRITNPEALGMSPDLMHAAINQGVRESLAVNF